ncbi:MAG: N-acetylmuramoyl-L-alanine amidase [Lachnospiraceae bacterium]
MEKDWGIINKEHVIWMGAGVKTYKRFFNRIGKMAVLFMGIFLFCGADACLVQAYENVTVVIDPGHGGSGTADDSDLGAKYNNVLEKDLTLTTALALKAELEQYGNVTVYLTRAEDKKMSLKERVDYAAALDADVLVSVHYNASASHRFYGAEVFTSAFGQNYATGYGLAQCVMSRWTEDGAADKGIKTRIGNSGADYYGLIRHGTAANIPTIILEHGYIDNDTDWERIGNETEWKNMGVIDAAGIADYYGLKKNVVQASVTPTVAVSVPLETMSPDLTPPSNVKLSIDNYDVSKKEVSYTLSGSEAESRLMYYSIATEQEAADADTAFMELRLWDSGQKHMSGTYTVPDGYEGALIVRIYNNYELYTDSELVSLSLDMVVNPPEAEKPVSEVLSPAGGEAAETDSVSSTNVKQAENADSEDNAEDTGQKTMSAGEKTLVQNEGADSANAVITKTGSSRSKALAGLIAATAVAVLVLIGAIAIAVGANAKRRRGKQRRR